MRKLRSKEVDKWWKSIRRAIFSCLPPKKHMNPNVSESIKAALHSGSMQCWFLTNGSNKIVSMTLTGVLIDPFVGSKALVIYALFKTKQHNDDLWDEWLQALKEFARESGCYDVAMFKKV